MPFQSFADVLAGGEGMEHDVASRNGYYNLLTPLSFCATFSPYLWSAENRSASTGETRTANRESAEIPDLQPGKSRVDAGNSALHPPCGSQ